MNDFTDPAAAPPAEPPAADPWAQVQPLSAERLPPQFRKHVDPAAPAPIRGMAAKGLVPLTPSDMCHALSMLAHDVDANIAAAARKTAAGLPDKIYSVALRDETLNPRVLHFVAEAMTGKDAALELLLLNNATHDLTVATIASTTTNPKLIEIVAANQLRLLREPSVIRAVLANPAASKALRDGACDFAVRSGLVLADLPEMVEAHVRVFGKPPPAPESQEAQEAEQFTAEAVMADFGQQITEADAPPLEESKKLNLTQRISKMNVAERIKLATLGNKEARSILLRDPNKVVLMAVINSPRITDGEVMGLAHSKTCPDDVLRVIMNTREWTRQYQIRMALVRNPKVPAAVAMRFLTTLRDTDVRDFAKDKNIPSAVRMQAKKLSEKKAGKA